MPVKVTMHRNWQAIAKGQWTKEGIQEAAVDIHRRAVMLAPVQDGHLAGSGRIEPVSGGYKIIFGSSRVRYARRRHFENNKNPQTKRYLSRAGDSVLRGDLGKYFRGKV